MLQPFTIHVDDAVLDDLRDRLARTRLPDDAGLKPWEDGTPPAYLAELVAHWRDRFDWREREAALNRFSQLRGEVDGAQLHLIHERGRGPAPFPLLLVHGWPDSVWRFEKLIPLLTDPAVHGGDPADAFDVIAPSLPGYGWSELRTDRAGSFGVGDLFATLMSELGYERYGAHGGDWGSTVVEHLARSHPDAVAGIHLTDVPFWHSFAPPDDPTPAEQKLVDQSKDWQMTEGAYALIQGTKPATLAAGLNDSPAGLAAWIVEKMQAWSDVRTSPEERYTKDELLTNITIYWVTQTIGSSFLTYRDFAKAGALRWTAEGAKNWLGGKRVPTGFAIFPKDIATEPRHWAERFFDVTRWTEFRRGGHFAAYEEPELLAEDLRAFFRPLRVTG